MPLTPTVAGKETIPFAAPEMQRLTAALAAGDEDAFRELHSRYFDRLFRYLFVVTRGDEDAARNALQETFTRVVRYIRPFESEEALWAWLTLLARSAALDAGRKQTRYWRMLARYAFFWRPEPELPGVADRVDLDSLLDAAMEVLEAADRALIEQKYFHDRRVRELAAELQMTEKAVESRLARARRQLRQELSRLLRDEEKQ